MCFSKKSTSSETCCCSQSVFELFLAVGTTCSAGGGVGWTRFAAGEGVMMRSAVVGVGMRSSVAGVGMGS